MYYNIDAAKHGWQFAPWLLDWWTDRWHNDRTLYLECTIVGFLHETYGKLPGDSNKNQIIMELEYFFQ